MSQTSGSSPAVIIIPGVGRFFAYSAGEILCGLFEGHPIVTCFDPATKRGGACRLNSARIEGDFGRWVEAVGREFGATSPAQLAGLQVKFITSHRQETLIKELCAKYHIIPMAVAGIEDKGRLDVFFYCDGGRLRIAPPADSAKGSGKPWVWKPEEQKVKVLIVDDSKTMRAVLRKILSDSPRIQVVAEAERPSQVEELIRAHQPDVMTLDINMPEMSGVETLRKLLPQKFIPTVMISSLSMDEGNEVLEALELGAVDYIQKPAANEIAQISSSIQEKILAAAKVKRAQSSDRFESHKIMPGATQAQIARSHGFLSSGVIAIGASTGGTEAIKQVFTSFPKDVPPIVVVQHIPPYFSAAFANRLNQVCEFEVREASDGDEVVPGLALIAPGGRHMEVKREGKKLIARLNDSEPVNRFRPSVDVLFRSVAGTCGSKAIGVILTGMGDDGAKGLKMMREAGAVTIAQDEESCVVSGMPRAAAELGAASVIESLEEIPGTLMNTKLAA